MALPSWATPKPNIITSPSKPASAKPEQGYSVGTPGGGGYEVSPTGKTTIIPKRSSGGGSSNLPQSSPTNITPPASSGQTMESVAAQSYNPKASMFTSSQGNLLSSQISKQSQNRIETVNRIEPLKEYGYVNPYKQSFFQSARESGGIIVKDVRELFGSRDFENPFTPFGKAGIGSMDIGKSLISSGLSFFPGFGGISQSMSPNVFNPVSKGQRLYGINIQKGAEQETIVNTFQTKAKDYSTELSKQAQSEYDTTFNIAQSSVTSGAWSLEQGKNYLKQVGTSIGTKYQAKSEDYTKGLNMELGGQINTIEAKYNKQLNPIRYGTLDLGKAVEVGVPLGIETGIALSSPVGAGLIGLKEFSFGAKEQNAFRMAGGLSMVGIPAGIQLARLPGEISSAEALGSLQRTQFKFAETRFVGATEDFSLIKGMRSTGSLNQEILVAGKVLKGDSLFIQPTAQFGSKISGTIPSAWGGNLFGLKPQSYVAMQFGELGSKGFTLPIGEAGNYFATVGKGNIVTQFETYGIANVKTINEPLRTVYHGTPSYTLDSIYSKGLKSDLGVFTSPSKTDAFGFATSRTFGKGVYVEGSSPQVLKITIPKSTEPMFEGIGKSGRTEVVFNDIAPPYIKGSQSYGNFKFRVDTEKLTESFKSNFKFPENKVDTSYFGGVSKKIREDLFLSRSGKITGMEFNPTKNIGGIQLIDTGLAIDMNLKDITLTRLIQKQGIKGVAEIEFNTKSGLQGLTQMPKSSFSGTGLIRQSVVQEARQSLVPKLSMQGITSTQKGFGTSGIGGGLIQVGRQKTSLGSFGMGSLKTSTVTGLSSKSLSSSFGSSLAKSTFQPVSTSYRQPQALSSGLSQLQTSKLDLGLKQVTVQQMQMPNVNPFGMGGFGGGGFSGFRFPGIPLPSLGSGLGVSKPKRVGKRKKSRVAPSLTAELFDLRGSLPKGGDFGISPFQLRRIPKGQKNPYATQF